MSFVGSTVVVTGVAICSESRMYDESSNKLIKVHSLTINCGPSAIFQKGLTIDKVCIEYNVSLKAIADSSNMISSSIYRISNNK